MSSILVFVVLLGGFFWLRMKRNTAPIAIVQTEGFVRSVFPDGTVEDQNDNGDIIYVFDENTSLRIALDGTVFKMNNGEAQIEPPVTQFKKTELRSPRGKKLSSIGVASDGSLEVFTENQDANQKLLEMLKKDQLTQAKDLLEQMDANKYHVDVGQLFYSCALSCPPTVWDFIQNHFNYTPPKQMWEQIALEALEVKPEHLDVAPAPLSYLLEMDNPEWVSNMFISNAVVRRRYDVLEYAFKYGNDFRTHAERMCYYAYNGENMALMFMEESGSTHRALAFYLAARNDKEGVAKSFLRSFTKEQQKGLKKMFSRLKSNPKQILKYFQ